MKKEVLLSMSAVLVLALSVAPALAERYSVRTVDEFTVFGNKKVAVIKTVDKGGPAGGGFMGTTRVNEYVVTQDNAGNVVKVADQGSASDGLGKGMVQNAVGPATGGFFYVWGQQTRRPDNYTTQVKTDVQTGAGTGAITLKNLQGQGQGQVGINSNFNSNLNSNLNKNCVTTDGPGWTPPGHR